MESYLYQTYAGFKGALQVYENHLFFLFEAENDEIYLYKRDLPIKGPANENSITSIKSESTFKVLITQKEIIDNLLRSYHNIQIRLPGETKKIIKLKNPPGIRHYRQSNNLFKKNFSQTDNQLIIDEIRAYQSISKSITDIFYTIEPTKNNLESYGHEIRNLFLVACTEVELLLKSFLSSNNYNKTKNLNMEDYYKSNRWLRLNEYKLRLPMYPKAGEFMPFENWGENKNSPPWYKAYNETKHDRRGQFDQATLNNLMQATAAIHSLICAQWGVNVFEEFGFSQHSTIFELVRFPAFKLEYLQPPEIGGSAENILRLKQSGIGCFESGFNLPIEESAVTIFPH